ncbi:MAG: hypothetical protein JWM98_847 [Thermoleophilia bacterium]|nr:hypothetical protein [Thermoleophilia bacterium]
MPDAHAHTLPAAAAPTPARPERRSRIVRLVRAAGRLAYTYPHVVTCVGLTLAFLGIAQAVAVHIGVPIRDPEGTLLGRRMIGPVLLMVLFAYLDSLRRAVLMWRGGTQGNPVRASVTIFRERWWWKRLTLAVIGFMSFAFTYLAYRNLKSDVSLINYRSYDQELLSLDRWLMFGHEPATVLHDLLGRGWMAQFLSWIYLIYIPLVAITVSVALAFVERMREAYVFVATYMWSWILGTASYYAIPTLGPFATRSRLFADLPPTNVARVQHSLERHRFDLMADNLGEDKVGGIAGFASLHVGIVVAVIMLMRYYRQRELMWVTVVYLVPVTISTSYFGWHFLVDDVAGVFIGWFSFVLGRATVYPRILAVWKRKVTHEPPHPATGEPSAGAAS